jgi:hypothetical protein
MTINPRQITSKAEFLTFLESLRVSLKHSPEQWENPTLESFLEALGGWIGAFEYSYQNRGEAVPTDINWRFMAEALTAGQMYE